MAYGLRGFGQVGTPGGCPGSPGCPGYVPPVPSDYTYGGPGSPAAGAPPGPTTVYVQNDSGPNWMVYAAGGVAVVALLAAMMGRR